MLVKNLTRQKILSDKVKVCRSLWSRLKGLLGTSELGQNESYWLSHCGSIHTIGMKYPINVYFLDKKNRVVAAISDLPPNRISPIYAKAFSVLEMAAGEAGCEVGDQLLFEINTDPADTQKSRKRLNAKGQGSVEFSIAFVVFAVLLMGIADTILTLYAKSVMHYVVYSAAQKIKLGDLTVTSPAIGDLRVKIKCTQYIKDSLERFGLKLYSVSYKDINGLTSNTGLPSEYLFIRVVIKPLLPNPVSEQLQSMIGFSMRSNIMLQCKVMLKNEPFEPI